MKQIKSLSVLLALLVVIGSGCLKDKGFDNHEYGINDPDASPAGVGFPLASKSNVVGLDAFSTTIQTNTSIVVVNLASGQAAPEDITVTVALKPSLVSDYNTANAAHVVLLRPADYTIPSFTTVIKKGTHLGIIPINIPNTLGLSLDSAYALGFTITSVSGSYKIIENQKDILVMFNAKNKYDGVYKMSGVHNRPPYDADPYKNIVMYMITTGPSSVTYFWPTLGDYAHPITNSGNYYGTFAPELFFDQATDKIINVINRPAPGSPPFTLGPATDSRYVASSKTIYAQFYYNGNLQRMFSDTLVYTGPRP